MFLSWQKINPFAFHARVILKHWLLKQADSLWCHCLGERQKNVCLISVYVWSRRAETDIRPVGGSGTANSPHRHDGYINHVWCCHLFYLPLASIRKEKLTEVGYECGNTPRERRQKGRDAGCFISRLCYHVPHGIMQDTCRCWPRTNTVIKSKWLRQTGLSRRITHASTATEQQEQTSHLVGLN